MPSPSSLLSAPFASPDAGTSKSHCTNTIILTLFVLAIAICTASCGGGLSGIFGSGDCCCYPTTSSTKNDGKVEDPGKCSNPSYYCAGNTADNSVEDRRAYALHCGTGAGLRGLNDNQMVFSSQPDPVPSSLSFRAQVVDPEVRPDSLSDALRRQDPSQCETECSSGGPFCLKVNLENRDSMLSKVEEARVLLANQSEGQIKTSQFMQIFQISQDPCKRQDTVLAPNQISNDGQPCYLNSAISSGSDSFRFTVKLPPTLQGKRETQRQELILSFDDPQKSPALIIGDADLNKDFGGIVERAAADSTSGILSTTRGCIAVRTQTPHQ